MKAICFKKASPIEKNPLEIMELKKPTPKFNEILVKISTCGICLTDRHQIEGDLPQKYSPTIPGHQIVGKVEELGKNAKKFKIGERVGISWLYYSCGKCYFCKNNLENLCYKSKFTGWDVQGGYAEYIKINENFAFKVPKNFLDGEISPLLCAGVIGYRALKLCKIKKGEKLGLFGFGSSANIVLQLAKYFGYKVYVFDRKEKSLKLAKNLDADWVGKINEKSEKLNSAITFAPSEDVFLYALENLQRNGRLIINAISMFSRKEKEFNYQEQFWYEKEIKSVANITIKDIQEFLKLAEKIPIKVKFKEFKFEDANLVLNLHKQKNIDGIPVLKF